MSERKRVQWAVIGWLCKISNSLGNCIKLTLAYCLECEWCKNSAVCFLIFILQLSLCRHQHIWRGQGLLRKPECFVRYTKRYVQYNILLFMPVTGNVPRRIHFSEFIWVFEFWDALGTLGFSVFKSVYRNLEEVMQWLLGSFKPKTFWVGFLSLSYLSSTGWQ